MDDQTRGGIVALFRLINPESSDTGAHTHLAHLADTASLTEGADGPHVALVPGAELWGVVVGGGIQGEARMHVPGGLQVVALTEQREKDGETGSQVGPRLYADDPSSRFN